MTYTLISYLHVNKLKSNEDSMLVVITSEIEKYFTYFNGKQLRIIWLQRKILNRNEIFKDVTRVWHVYLFE